MQGCFRAITPACLPGSLRSYGAKLRQKTKLGLSEAPMNAWSVELRVSPSLERPGPRGFVVHVRAAYGQSAQVWAVLGDWLEQPPTVDLTRRTATTIAADKSRALIESLASATLTPVPPAAWGIHGTTFQLKIWSGMNSSEHTWYGDLPPEWEALAPAILSLQKLAQEYAVEA